MVAEKIQKEGANFPKMLPVQQVEYGVAQISCMLVNRKIIRHIFKENS
jgi:hypothetical protein